MKTLTWLGSPDDGEWFPPLDAALDDPPGLLAAGGELTSKRIIAAYRRGIFPWYSPGQPVLWWSPDPRAVLFPDEFHRSRSLAKSERNRGYVTRLDCAFATVMDACAAPRRYADGTWITPQMRAAYLALHRLGVAHSVETWCADELIGGLYGVQLGRVFFGESMFSLRSDASKVALARLVDACRQRGIVAIDCQMHTSHLQTLGSRLLPRSDFVALLAHEAHASVPNAW